jgi:hypothetical protein
MSRIAADYMAEALAQAGVERVCGVVGDSLNGFTDALRRLKSIEWIHVRYEAHKFGVFMLKAVLDGRAGEPIDLAKVNLTP